LPRTLLLIEDSRAIRHLILRMLVPSGLFDVCLQATDGSQGLEMVAAHHVDIILCDLDMPVLDGFAFLESLRADRRYDTIPVLMLSANDHRRRRVEGLDRGANDYIGKPCDPAELRARVQHHLRSKIREDKLDAANRTLARTNRELRARAITLPATPVPDTIRLSQSGSAAAQVARQAR